MALRMLLRPLASLLSDYIQRSGKTWSQRQLATVARALLQGEQCKAVTSFVAFLRQTSEKIFFQSLRDLLRSPDWSHLPTAAKHLSFECICFRIASRMGACVHELLAQLACRCPCPLLRLPDDPTPATAAVLQAQRSCCQDDFFTRRHLEAFPGATLLGADSLAVLNAVVSTTHSETVGVEWGHGRVHRLITTAAVQTHTPTTEFIGSQWLCQRIGQVAAAARGGRQADREETATPALPAQAPPQGQEMATKRPQRGGGGAWRAFVAMRTRGATGKVDFPRLAEDYRAAQSNNSLEYQQALRAGEAATVVHRTTGMPAFGEPTRQLRRKRRTQLLQARAAQAVLMEHTPEAALEHVSAAGAEHPVLSLQGHITQVRRSAKALRQQETAARQHLLDHIELLKEDRNPATLELLYTFMPELIHLPLTFNLVNLSPWAAFDVLPRHLPDGALVAAWATAQSRHSNVHSALKADWKQRHSTIAGPQENAPTRPPRGPHLCVLQARFLRH